MTTRSSGIERLHDRDTYYLAFGRFMHEFSMCEARVIAFLVWKSSTDEKMSKALMSGVRVDAATSLIRRVYETLGETIEPYIDDALTQVSIINGVRNDIVHYGATFDQEVPKVTTARAAHIPERVREFEVPPDLLWDLVEDLSRVSSILVAHRLYVGLAREYGSTNVGSVSGDRTWRYKPPSQASNRRKTRDKQPKQRRPPKPSPGSPQTQQ